MTFITYHPKALTIFPAQHHKLDLGWQVNKTTMFGIWMEQSLTGFMYLYTFLCQFELYHMQQTSPYVTCECSMCGMFLCEWNLCSGVLSCVASFLRPRGRHVFPLPRDKTTTLTDRNRFCQCTCVGKPVSLELCFISISFSFIFI